MVVCFSGRVGDVWFPRGVVIRYNSLGFFVFPREMKASTVMLRGGILRRSHHDDNDHGNVTQIENSRSVG